MRATIFLVFCAPVALTLQGCGESGIGAGESGVPTDANYRIEIQGVGSFSGVPSTNWTVAADLALRPGFRENPIDVGVFTLVSPIVGQAGALYFGSNTSLSALVGTVLGDSDIDIASVSLSQDGTVVTRIRGDLFGLPVARLGTFNIYNLTSGVTAQVHNVLAGEMTFQVSDDGRSVTGEIRIGGSSGFAGPNITSEYTAGFTGTRLQ